MVYRSTGRSYFSRPLKKVQKPTKKSAKLLFFALFATVCKNHNRVAEPAGACQYFTGRVFNGIERASFCFGFHMSCSRLPADFQILVAAKKSKNKQKNMTDFTLKEKFLWLRLTNMSSILEVC